MDQYIIDITRFLSRLGLGYPTGIDRVERKYIQHLSTRNPGFLAVGKMGKEFVLLNGSSVLPMLNDQDVPPEFGKAGLKDRFRFKIPIQQRRSRTYFRKKAIGVNRTIGSLLEAVNLKNHEYINVGHTNLTFDTMTALQKSGCRKVSVMVHDMIPLDNPEYTKAGISEQFERRMRVTSQFADRVICNSAYTKSRVLEYFTQWGRKPPIQVAHLGIQEIGAADWAGPMAKRSFVVLGTIEPRKNHQILFDAWTKMSGEIEDERVPELYVVGRRGWENKNVFEFLDNSPLMGRKIFECPEVDDQKLFELMAASSGLLFPSHVEGYGLPALEAAQIGVPVYCSDLEVFRDLMGEHATYINPNCVDDWVDMILSVANKTKKHPNSGSTPQRKLTIPRWDTHFDHVFGNTGDRQIFDE